MFETESAAIGRDVFVQSRIHQRPPSFHMIHAWLILLVRRALPTCERRGHRTRKPRCTNSRATITRFFPQISPRSRPARSPCSNGSKSSSTSLTAGPTSCPERDEAPPCKLDVRRGAPASAAPGTRGTEFPRHGLPAFRFSLRPWNRRHRRRHDRASARRERWRLRHADPLQRAPHGDGRHGDWLRQ